MAEENKVRVETHFKPPGGQWWNPLNNQHFDFLPLTDRRCTEFYKDFMQCSTRTGLQNSASRCKEQYEDLKECITKEKRTERLQLIQAERIRQGRPPIDPLPVYAQQSGEHIMNTERMQDDSY